MSVNGCAPETYTVIFYRFQNYYSINDATSAVETLWRPEGSQRPPMLGAELCEGVRLHQLLRQAPEIGAQDGAG